MVEAKKCSRCGAMYISNGEVCGKCEKKDGADLYKLKGYMSNVYGEISQNELAAATGILNKNLNRFLGYDEFKGIQITKNVSDNSEINGVNGIELELI